MFRGNCKDEEGQLREWMDESRRIDNFYGGSENGTGVSNGC